MSEGQVARVGDAMRMIVDSRRGTGIGDTR